MGKAGCSRSELYRSRKCNVDWHESQGYLASRATSLELRIKRVIIYDVMPDFFACVTSGRGKVAAYLIKGLTGLRLSFVLGAFAKVIMKRDMYLAVGDCLGYAGV